LTSIEAETRLVLVLLHLLEGDAEGLGQRLLADAQRLSAQADASADDGVDVVDAAAEGGRLVGDGRNLLEIALAATTHGPRAQANRCPL
jgi:hypothetical protein